MKIASIVGARPNFIKLDTEMRNQVIIHTGQHYDYLMSKVFFDELKLPDPAVNLNRKRVGAMVDRLMSVLKGLHPDFVQVFGDTKSSFAGALAAAYLGIPIAHIESGLRSYDMTQPEEVNRVLIDRMAKVRFAPNDEAVLNLKKEGITENVYNVGDPQFDTMLKFIPIPKTGDAGKYSVLTVHRDFNDNDQFFSEVFQAIRDSGEKFIFPAHPRLGKFPRHKNIKITKPLSYRKMLSLVSNAKRVLTDSGGVQREAFWMNVPVVILRKETEWSEILNKGGGILAHDYDSILAAMKFEGHMNAPPRAGAKKRIRDILFKFL